MVSFQFSLFHNPFRAQRMVWEALEATEAVPTAEATSEPTDESVPPVPLHISDPYAAAKIRLDTLASLGLPDGEPGHTA